MNLVIPRSALLELADHAASVASPSSPSKIVQNVRLDAEAGALTARATDYCLSYEGRRGAAVDKSGSILVSARNLRDVVAVLHDGDVSLSVARNTLTLATGRRRFMLPTQPGEDYPEVKHASGHALSVDAAALSATLRRTHYAQASAEKPHLSATRMTAHGASIRTEATDGLRAAVDARDVLDESTRIDVRALAPRTWVDLVLRQLAEGKAGLTFDADRLTIDVGQDRWTSLCHQSTNMPPDLRALAPEARCTVTVDRADLLGALNATAIAVADLDLVVAELDPRERAIRLRSESNAYVIATKKTGKKLPSGADEEELTLWSRNGFNDEIAATFDGPAPPVFGINRQHMLETLRSLDCPKVELRFHDELHPVTVVDPGAPGYASVISAIRVPS